MNIIIKENWEIIEQKLIKNMYEDGEFPLSLADEIKELLEKHINGGWIKCSERLPDKADEVMACNKDGVIVIGYLKQKLGYMSCEHLPFVTEDILAWQPLPTPY